MRLSNCSVFFCALHCVNSSFVVILMGKRKLIALLCLFFWCLVIVVWFYFTLPRVYVQFMIVVFPDYIHLLCFNQL